MIIFGTGGVTYSKGNGDFFCPECSSDRPYKHKRVRRFFNLYFIPIVPLDLVGEYVECQQCRGTYHLSVLEYDPESLAQGMQAEFHKAVKRVMVLMMLADGNVDPEEVRIVREVYGQLANVQLSEDEVNAEIEDAQSDSRGIEAYLADLAGNLNDTGKEIVLRGAFLVAAADGEFQEEEQQLMGSIGQALGMSSAHVNGVLSALTDEAASEAP